MKKKTKIIIIFIAAVLIALAVPACMYLFTLHESEKPIMAAPGERTEKGGALGEGSSTPRGYHECTLTVKGTLEAGSFDLRYTNQITGETVKLTFDQTGTIDYSMPVKDIGGSEEMLQEIHYDFSQDARVNVTTYLEGKSYGYEILGQWLYGFVPK